MNQFEKFRENLISRIEEKETIFLWIFQTKRG